MPGVLCHGQSTPSRERALRTNVPAQGTFGRAARAVRPEGGGGRWQTRACPRRRWCHWHCLGDGPDRRAGRPGIDLAAADVIIGTSAGSLVGADIASGQEPEALAARTMPESGRRKVFQARLPVSDWHAKVLKVTAVDARAGEFVVFDSAGEAGLVDAVGASCAVPGVWPPVTIGNRRFVDGGAGTAIHTPGFGGHPHPTATS
jgi:hypothetical protein